MYGCIAMSSYGLDGRIDSKGTDAGALAREGTGFPPIPAESTELNAQPGSSNVRGDGRGTQDG